MTKREICERLISVCEKMTLIFNDTDDPRAVWAGEEVREILLDLAAPEDHFADPGKMVREEPPVLLYEENGEKVPCPGCGAPASHILNTPGMFRCKRCGVFFCREEREEEGK